MHFEVLVEDQSGKKKLDVLIPKIIGDQHTFKIHAYRGIGRIPKNLKNDKCLKAFRRELFDVLESCNPQPETRFCIAIEEGEAWFLGDLAAIKAAYPKAKNNVLNGYINDSICGTWELLADAICPGGLNSLKKKGWQAVGREKSNWSENIAPHMDVEINTSPSFCYFRGKVRELAAIVTL